MGDSHKSVSSFLIMMGASPLSWSSKQQAVVTLSESLFCYNQGTVACTHDPHAHPKMKHISIQEHFSIQDHITKCLIDVIHIYNKGNTANLLTKPLHHVLHTHWVNMCST